MRRCATPDRGFVLLNALLLVAAFAAAAVYVLGRAEAARLRQAEQQGAGQLRLYLDGFEVLAMQLLRRDQQGGAVDTLSDIWARPIDGVSIDRGALSGQISDLQGRFNINWLANAQDLGAAAGFVRLLAQLGLPPRLADEITGFVRPGGPADSAGYARLTPPVIPQGGPVLLLEQVQDIPALQPRHYARLAPYLAALPSDSLLNLNTVSPEVLISLLPDANVGALEQLLLARRHRPFISVEDFILRSGAAFSVAPLPESEELRLAVGSAWFHAKAEVQLEDRSLTRQILIHRRPLPFGPQITYRLGGAP
jgi:general secretion pathway protein K